MAEKFTYTTLEEISVLSKESLQEQLEYLGIKKGMTLLVEADMSRMGYIVGEEQAVIEALMDVLGYEGTLVMASFTPYMAAPSCRRERLQRTYWEMARNAMSAFDRKLHVPKTEHGLIQQFLRNDGVARSYHPLYSFAAWGKYARLICAKHPLHFALNEDSPLGKLCDFNGYTLLLGADYAQCPMFHLAGYKTDRFPVKMTLAPIQSGNRTVWKKMLDIAHHNEKADAIGRLMEDKSVVKKVFVGTGCCRFFSCREAVQNAAAYLNMSENQ